ncbi:MAG: HNH endonuclease [Bacteroidota bacterium]
MALSIHACPDCGVYFEGRRGKIYCGSTRARTGCSYKRQLARNVERTRHFNQINRHRRLQLRFRVLHKCGYKCVYCGASSTERRLEIDHVIPVSKGGSWEHDNLVAACS